jgi:hypothetical protein
MTLMRMIKLFRLALLRIKAKTKFFQHVLNLWYDPDTDPDRPQMECQIRIQIRIGIKTMPINNTGILSHYNQRER